MTTLEIRVLAFQESDVYDIHRARYPGTRLYRNQASRNDCVWIQVGGEQMYGALRGSLPAKLLVLFKIRDYTQQDAVRHTAPRRMRGPSYPTLEAQTSRKEKATPPSGPGVGTIGHQPLPGKLGPLTKNLRIGTYLVTPYTSRPSVQPVPVRRIYERRPSGTLCKWNQLNRATAHKVTDIQSQLTRKCQ